MFDGRGAPFNHDKVPIYSFNDVDVMRDPRWSVVSSISHLCLTLLTSVLGFSIQIIK